MKLKEGGDAYELDAEGYAEAPCSLIVFDDPETYEPLR